jgi:glyoxylase-like metal-dependent hydrolase (beta-lactamase superfamily II)
MRVTGTRQLEAWRQREFPPVEQVTPGVWSVPVPIPIGPLRYVLSYLIEHRSGFVMVDTGWDNPDSWAGLVAGLKSCDIPLSAVTAVLVTHVHPDHHGLSAAVREQSGAWIGMHERESELLTRMAFRPTEQQHWPDFLRWCGAPAGHIEELVALRGASQHGGDRRRQMAKPDRTIADGELIDAPGLTLRALWTPGHTPGHLCFRDETHDLLLTGDHVLPRITPNISAFDTRSRPLADYLRSLAALRGIQPGEVLPAHEYRFTGLDSRLADITSHHERRLAEIRGVLAAAPDGLTAWQVAERVTWSRGWDRLSGFPRQAALGEVLSHLRELQDGGATQCTEDAQDTGTGPVGRWQPAGPG